MIKEECRRRKHEYWVKMSGNPELTDRVFRQNLAEMFGIQVGKMKKVPGGFLVECKTEAGRQLLLELDGGIMNHRK